MNKLVLAVAAIVLSFAGFESLASRSQSLTVYRLLDGKKLLEDRGALSSSKVLKWMKSGSNAAVHITQVSPGFIRFITVSNASEYVNGETRITEDFALHDDVYSPPYNRLAGGGKEGVERDIPKILKPAYARAKVQNKTFVLVEITNVECGVGPVTYWIGGYEGQAENMPSDCTPTSVALTCANATAVRWLTQELSKIKPH